jgi:hypothetical protein
VIQIGGSPPFSTDRFPSIPSTSFCASREECTQAASSRGFSATLLEEMYCELRLLLEILMSC